MNKELANPFNQGYKHKPKDSKLTCPICHKGFSECKHSLTEMIKEYNKIIKQALEELKQFKRMFPEELRVGSSDGVLEVDNAIKFLEGK